MPARSALNALNFRRIYELIDEEAERFALGLEDRDAYHAWYDVHEAATLNPSESTFEQQILSTNFYNSDDAAALLRLLDREEPVYVPLGTFNGTGFRIKLSRDVLETTVPTSTTFPSILPPEFLGLLRGVNVATPKVGNIRKNSSTNLTPRGYSVERRTGEACCLKGLEHDLGQKRWTFIWKLRAST
jgi:hypothetical protein